MLLEANEAQHLVPWPQSYPLRICAAPPEGVFITSPSPGIWVGDRERERETIQLVASALALKIVMVMKRTDRKAEMFLLLERKWRISIQRQHNIQRLHNRSELSLVSWNFGGNFSWMRKNQKNSFLCPEITTWLQKKIPGGTNLFLYYTDLRETIRNTWKHILSAFPAQELWTGTFRGTTGTRV